MLGPAAILLLPLSVWPMAVTKLCAAKSSAQVLAQNLKPEVGASSDAHLLLSCEAYLEAISNSSQSYSIDNHIITLWKSNHASILAAGAGFLLRRTLVVRVRHERLQYVPEMPPICAWKSPVQVCACMCTKETHRFLKCEKTQIRPVAGDSCAIAQHTMWQWQ